MVKCRNTTGKDLSEDMKDVFDQHNDMDRNGNVTGGKGKHLCLHYGTFDITMIRTLVNTPCRIIIEKLRILFRDLNYFSQGADSDSDSDQLFFETKRQEATEKLRSSEWILKMINEQLSSEWDVDDDGSLHKSVLCPDSAASKNRHKRKAEDINDEKMTFNQRRRGPLPLRSIPSRSTLWSQGTHSHSHSRSGTSARRVSTRSQSLRSVSLSSEAAYGSR